MIINGRLSFWLVTVQLQGWSDGGDTQWKQVVDNKMAEVLHKIVAPIGAENPKHKSSS